MQKDEIICRIKKIEKLLDNFKKHPFYNYNNGKKIHQKQLDFHKCISRNRWVFGGNRTGKTECGAMEVVFFARGCHPYRKIVGATNGWVVSLSREVSRDVAQGKILKFLPKQWIADIVMNSGKKDNPEGGVIDYILIKNIFGTLSRIGFKSCDQGREKFQGTSLNYVWFDEEPPLEIYQECQMRVLDTAGDIFGTMTPLKGLTWVYDEIYLNEKQNPQVWCIFMEWCDNPFLNEKEVGMLGSALSESQLESRKYGRFMQNEGMVYPEFSVQETVIEPFDIPKEWFSAICIDPGFTNPLAALWIARDFDENIYVINEYYQKNKTVAYHAEVIKNLSKELGWPLNNKGMLEAVMDSAANQRTLASQQSVAELFLEQGILANTNINKDVFAGIQKIKNALLSINGKRKLFVFKNCVNTIREFKNYWWGQNENPNKKDDHCLDALRYYINLPPIASKPQKKSVVEKNMEKYILQNKLR